MRWRCGGRCRLGGRIDRAVELRARRLRPQWRQVQLLQTQLCAVQGLCLPGLQHGLQQQRLLGAGAALAQFCLQREARIRAGQGALQRGLGLPAKGTGGSGWQCCAHLAVELRRQRHRCAGLQGKRALVAPIGQLQALQVQAVLHMVVAVVSLQVAQLQPGGARHLELADLPGQIDL